MSLQIWLTPLISSKSGGDNLAPLNGETPYDSVELRNQLAETPAAQTQCVRVQKPSCDLACILVSDFNPNVICYSHS